MVSHCRIPGYRGFTWWIHKAEYRDNEVSYDGFTKQNTGIPRFHMMVSQCRILGYRGFTWWIHNAKYRDTEAEVMMDSGFRMYIQYNIFLSLLLQNKRWINEATSLFVCSFNGTKCESAKLFFHMSGSLTQWYNKRRRLIGVQAS